MDRTMSINMMTCFRATATPAVHWLRCASEDVDAASSPGGNLTHGALQVIRSLREESLINRKPFKIKMRLVLTCLSIFDCPRERHYCEFRFLEQ